MKIQEKITNNEKINNNNSRILKGKETKKLLNLFCFVC
jgi:hypothetical protein